MKATILFFGATADWVEKKKIEIPIDQNSNPADLVQRLACDYPKLKNRKLMFAVNEEYVDADQVLYDGDEVAIFTAVSGG
jgi:Molybdopterin converting factor, small subunit